jgi:hypothetical protein
MEPQFDLVLQDPNPDAMIGKYDNFSTLKENVCSFVCFKTNTIIFKGNKIKEIERKTERRNAKFFIRVPVPIMGKARISIEINCWTRLCIETKADPKS